MVENDWIALLNIGVAMKPPVKGYELFLHLGLLSGAYLVHICLSYEPRVKNEKNSPFSATHSRFVKRGIAKDSLKGGHKKKTCLHTVKLTLGY